MTEQNSSISLQEIETKIGELQVKYREAIQTKTKIMEDYKKIEEEINKLVGAYQSLMELKQQIEAKPKEENV